MTSQFLPKIIVKKKWKYEPTFNLTLRHLREKRQSFWSTENFFLSLRPPDQSLFFQYNIFLWLTSAGEKLQIRHYFASVERGGNRKLVRPAGRQGEDAINGLLRHIEQITGIINTQLVVCKYNATTPLPSPHTSQKFLSPVFGFQSKVIFGSIYWSRVWSLQFSIWEKV